MMEERQTHLSFELVQTTHFGELGFGQLVVRVVLERLPKVPLCHALIVHVEVGLAPEVEGLDIVRLPFQQDPHHGHYPCSFT